MKNMILLAACAALIATACIPDQPRPPASSSPMTGTSTTQSSVQTSPTATEPVVFGYEFPVGKLTATSSPDGMPTRIGATMAVPGSPGPHPVVIIMHGSYPNCLWLERNTHLTGSLNTVEWPLRCGTTEKANDEVSEGKDYVRWDASFALMARELARQSMVAVAIDLSAKEVLEFGEANPDLATRQVLDLHRRLLADLNKGVNHGLTPPTTLKGSMDLNRVAFVGHSSSGGYLAQQLDAGSHQARAMVLLQPVAESEDTTPWKKPVPLMVVQGQCDEQANPQAVAQYARHALTRTGATPVVHVETGGATHIAQIGGGDHRVGLVSPVTSPQCARGKLASPAAVRGTTARLVADFLAQAMSGATTIALTSHSGAPSRIVATNAAASVTLVQQGPHPADLPAADVRYRKSNHPLLPTFTGKRIKVEG